MNTRETGEEMGPYLNSRNQITLPQRVIDDLNLTHLQPVFFFKDANGRWALRTKQELLDLMKDEDEAAKVVYADSNANGDGRTYPESWEVREGTVSWEVWDTTGWDGHETCGDMFVARFAYEHDAIDFCKIKVLWSDPLNVVTAAVALLNKDPASFKALKDAVDWRDRR